MSHRKQKNCRMGSTGQCSRFCPFFCFLCDIQSSHPVLLFVTYVPIPYALFYTYVLDYVTYQILRLVGPCPMEVTKSDKACTIISLFDVIPLTAFYTVYIVAEILHEASFSIPFVCTSKSWELEDGRCPIERGILPSMSSFFGRRTLPSRPA